MPRRASSSTTANPTLCRVPRYFAPGIAEPDDELSSRGYFFLSSFFLSSFFSSSSSFLPFLMTSGSAGVAGAAAAAASGRRRHFLGLRHDDVDEHHVGVADRLPLARRSAMSRTRTPWCSISSLTSTSMCSGMSAGRHSISISRRTNSRMPPCCLTPFGSPLHDDRDGDAQHLVHRDAVEVGVQQLVRDRIELVLLDEHARVARARRASARSACSRPTRSAGSAAAPSGRRRSASPRALLSLAAP